MDNIIMTEKLLADPEYIFTEEGKAECERLYAEFIAAAVKWTEEE